MTGESRDKEGERDGGMSDIDGRKSLRKRLAEIKKEQKGDGERERGTKESHEGVASKGGPKHLIGVNLDGLSTETICARV